MNKLYCYARCISMHFIIGVWCGMAWHFVMTACLLSHSLARCCLFFTLSLLLLFVSALRSFALNSVNMPEHIAIVFIAHRDVYRIMYIVYSIFDWIGFLWLVGHCEWVCWLILRRWKMEITVWLSHTDNLIDTSLFMCVCVRECLSLVDCL